MERIARIVELLRKTREDPRIKQIEEGYRRVLEEERISSNENGVWIIKREHRIQLAIRAIELGASPERVIKELTWKDFEGLIASILQANGFRCIQSFRRRGDGSNRGMEIDVIGVRGHRILSIDAKMWGVRSGKSSALQAAAEKQVERSKRLANDLHALRERMGHLNEGRYDIIPVLTTWLIEDIEFHEGVPIVPVFKFNTFVLQLEEFEDMLFRVNTNLHD